MKIEVSNINFQKELFKRISKLSHEVKNLSLYVQNDLEDKNFFDDKIRNEMVNDFQENFEKIIVSLDEVNTDFKKLIDNINS